MKLLAQITHLKTRCWSCAEPKWRQLLSFYSALCKQDHGVCLGGVGLSDPESSKASFPLLAMLEVQDAKGKKGSGEGDEQSQERLEEQLKSWYRKETQRKVSLKHLAMTIHDGQIQQAVFHSSTRKFTPLLQGQEQQPGAAPHCCSADFPSSPLLTC